MNGLLVILGFILGIGIMVVAPGGIGQGALLVLVATSLLALACLNSFLEASEKESLLQLFGAALLMRVAVGTIIYVFKLQVFFGGDALGYDEVSWLLLQFWQGDKSADSLIAVMDKSGWGMHYFIAGVYWLIGRNSLAVQFINAVIGAATAPLAFMCALQMFGNLRVARLTAYFVAFFPSLVLWSAQGLKDGPIVFLLVLVMLATMRLGERLSAKYFVLLVAGLLGLLGLRFYVFYMALAAAAGAFLIGMRAAGRSSILKQLAMVLVLGLVLTYVGVLQTASSQFETYGSLERVQMSRADLARTESGFGRDVDVSTTGGALQAIPIGVIYLLFAPFPWQLANLRQSITLPEMLVWWGCFPLLVTGIWFTLKFRLRQALPILIFTAMLTLAYSIFQGNVGTAYRQRSQLLVFYFIFVAVGFVLMKERREDRQRRINLEREALRRVARPGRGTAPNAQPQTYARR